MNLNKFTEKAQEAVFAAQQLAQDDSHSEMLPGHLLLALLRQEGGVVPQIARHLSVNPDAVAQNLETELQGAAKVYGGSQPTVSRTLNNVLREAQKVADQMRDEYVSTEHLLLALAEAGDRTASLLRRFGMPKDASASPARTRRAPMRPCSNMAAT